MSGPDPTHGNRAVERTAEAIADAFERFRQRFRKISRRAAVRFASRDWSGQQRDAAERLDLYQRTVDEVVGPLPRPAGGRATWRRVRGEFAARLERHPASELGWTFYNSVTRRLHGIVGVDSELEFVAEAGFPDRTEHDPGTELRVRLTGGSVDALSDGLAKLFGTLDRGPDLADPAGDVRRIARVVAAALQARPSLREALWLEVLRPLYYRQKLAFVLGRVRCTGGLLPAVIALVPVESGARVDAVLTEENDVSILFSFARSYFHVDTDAPRPHVAFLRSLLPHKPLGELYSSLGFHRHGKTELYGSLRRHLNTSDDRFEVAIGTPGMVMLVFTLPGFDVVFKVIRDTFDYPKKHRRDQVIDRYRLVFAHDRVGRLVDAREFEYLEFPVSRFDPALLESLCRDAARTVSVEGDQVLIRHLYTERRVSPLDVFLRSADAGDCLSAALDWGQALKDLAAANIFAGDFLLKNFGVTRHGRVVFYDYDELGLVTDQRFRRLPPPRFPEEEMEAEPWFTVADNDVFPEEFRSFTGLPEPLRTAFIERHGDLFDPAFWQGLQRRLEQGEVLDAFPYRLELRLTGDSPSAGRQGSP